MRVHHIGIACPDIEEAIRDFGKYHDIVWQSSIVNDPLQNAKLCIIKTNLGIDYEFISGPQVERLIKKGITYYHTCYEVDSIYKSIEVLMEKGAVMISEPKPAVLFDNKMVAFLYLSYGLIELLEK